MSALTERCRHFALTRAAPMTHIVGMSLRHADKTGQDKARDPVERLRNSGVVGFFRAAQLEHAGLTRKPRLRELKLRTMRFSGPAWNFGVQETAFEGVPARITSPARTVADCFRFERLVGPEAAMEALQDGLRQRKVTVAELTRVVEVL